MIINPYRFAAAPPPAGFDTSMLTGRTYIYSPGVSSIYKGLTIASGAATANGDRVQRIDTGPGPATARVISQPSAIDAVLFQTDTFGSGLDAVRSSHASIDNVFQLQPAVDNPPSVNQLIGDLWGANNKLFIFAGTVLNARTDTGLPYTNDYIIADFGQYCGLHCYKSGTDLILQWYSWSGSAVRVNTTSVPLGSPFVVACRHGSSQLSMSVNNGAWTSPSAAGDTDVMGQRAQALRFGVTDAADTAVIVTCNDVNASDTDVADACTNAGALVGISI